MTTPTVRLRPPAALLTARTPEDVLAAVPVVLGFEPARLGRDAHLRRPASPSTPGSTCRRDRVRPARGRRACCSSRRCSTGSRQVLFVVYTDDGPAGPARRAGAWRDAFARAGIDVVEVLRADGERWWSRRATRRAPGRALRPRQPPVPRPGGGRRAGGARLPRGAARRASPARAGPRSRASSRRAGRSGRRRARPGLGRRRGRRGTSRAGTPPGDAELARLLRGPARPAPCATPPGRR